MQDRAPLSTPLLVCVSPGRFCLCAAVKLSQLSIACAGCLGRTQDTVMCVVLSHLTALAMDALQVNMPVCILKDRAFTRMFGMCRNPHAGPTLTAQGG